MSLLRCCLLLWLSNYCLGAFQTLKGLKRILDTTFYADFVPDEILTEASLFVSNAENGRPSLLTKENFNPHFPKQPYRDAQPYIIISGNSLYSSPLLNLDRLLCLAEPQLQQNYTVFPEDVPLLRANLVTWINRLVVSEMKTIVAQNSVQMLNFLWQSIDRVDAGVCNSVQLTLLQLKPYAITSLTTKGEAHWAYDWSLASGDTMLSDGSIKSGFCNDTLFLIYPNPSLMVEYAAHAISFLEDTMYLRFLPLDANIFQAAYEVQAVRHLGSWNPFFVAEDQINGGKAFERAVLSSITLYQMAKRSPFFAKQVKDIDLSQVGTKEFDWPQLGTIKPTEEQRLEAVYYICLNFYAKIEERSQPKLMRTILSNVLNIEEILIKLLDYEMAVFPLFNWNASLLFSSAEDDLDTFGANIVQALSEQCYSCDPNDN